MRWFWVCGGGFPLSVFKVLCILQSKIGSTWLPVWLGHWSPGITNTTVQDSVAFSYSHTADTLILLTNTRLNVWLIRIGKFLLAGSPTGRDKWLQFQYLLNDQKLPTCLLFHQRDAHSAHNWWINDQAFYSSKRWCYFLSTSKHISWVSVSVILALYWLGIGLIPNFTVLHTPYFVATHLHVQDHLCRTHSQEADCSVLSRSRNVPPLTPCWPKPTLHLAPHRSTVTSSTYIITSKHDIHIALCDCRA